MSTIRNRSLAAASVLLAAACARTPRPASAPAADTAEAPAPPLEVPRVDGPLRLRVQYPRADQLIPVRDSNFIFGETGSGSASLTINDVPVRVYPNGAFMGWLAVPADGRYRLVAARAADTARLEQPIRLPEPARTLGPADRLLVDTASLTPARTAVLSLRDEEPVRVSLRVPGNADVRIVVADTAARRALRASGSPVVDSTTGALRVVGGDSTRGEREGGVQTQPREADVRWSLDVPAGALRRGGTVLVARGADTVRLPLPVVSDPEGPFGSRVVLGAGAPPAGVSDTDRVVIVRPTPGGTYKWFFLPGTVAEVTGRQGDWYRLRLDETLEAWVAAADATPVAAAAPAPRRVALNARVVPADEWVDLRIPVSERPPHLVQAEGDVLLLTLYGTQSNTDILQIVGNDPLVRWVTWEQVTSDRVEYRLHLASPPYGWQALWQGGAFVLRVRRPPRVDRGQPLRGLRIVVDPGHPPAGATGPTGLYEGDAVLAIGLKLRDMLQQRGATVIMTRTTRDTVDLGLRPIIARRENAHALVSIHLNALPDGVNPFTAHGTGTYWFHPQAAPLARQVQRGMVRRMGLPDLGIYYDNLALTRQSWMPSILCEGAFVIMPDQEAALRTDAFQMRYARGVAEGIEAYFRALAP
ncbi:MAG: N-acetylmuramoyl-L-alanine amidase [Gemmatimonadaceae bacterium]